MEHVLPKVPRSHRAMVAAAVRTIFAQPDQAAVFEQFGKICSMLTGEFGDVAAMLADARDDLLALGTFPAEHGGEVT